MSGADNHLDKFPKETSILSKKGVVYRPNCNSGFRAAKGSIKQWEAHHIACDRAISKRMAEYPEGTDRRRYIDMVVKAAGWDINASDNLIGLPIAHYFKEYKGYFSPSLPSHWVDHNTGNGYSMEVRTWLKVNIWNTITLKSGENPHKEDIENVKSLLVQCTNEFRRKLEGRGLREGGTNVGWEKRFDPTWKFRWYRPFSMAARPSHRHPGISNDKLDQIFKKLRRP